MFFDLLVPFLGITCISSPSKSNLSTTFEITGNFLQVLARRKRDLKVNLMNFILIS